MPIRISASRWFSLLFGLIILLFAAIVQTSSVLTPELAHYPLLLYLFGSLGIDILLVGVAGYFFCGLRWKSKLLLALAAITFVAYLWAQYTAWGSALQFSLVGVTIGGGLLFLGCKKSV